MNLSAMIIAVACELAWGIVPLPYSTEPPPEETETGEVQTIDPSSLPGYSALFSQGQLRAMELPEFGHQDNALGYEPDTTFTVPGSLRHRVDFWKKIYTVYTSSQAVLHDADNLDIQYDILDLSTIQSNTSLSTRQKRRAIARFIKSEKKKLAQKLRDLDRKRDRPGEIKMSLFPLFTKWKSVQDPKKFLKASRNIRAQVGQSDKILQGFLFGGRYWNKMMEIFESRGIPKELTRLPLVESAFDLSARSKVGASGVWQFMRSTGKRYLRIDRGIDERNDPITATWGAAELLRQNYEALQSWPLAITAYNHGREGVARAVRLLETRDLAEIIESYDSSTFGFASSNFYSEFLAILEVEREYRKHFGSIMVDAPISYEEITIPQAVKFSKLAEICGIKPDELAFLNPAFTSYTLKDKATIPAEYPVRIPQGSRRLCNQGAI